MLLIFSSCKRYKYDQQEVTEAQLEQEFEELIEKTETESNAIIYNPKYTYDEWVYSLLGTLFKNESSELLGVMELDATESTFSLLFVAKHDEQLGYYTLMQQQDYTFNFKEVELFKESAVVAYALDPRAYIDIYDLKYYDTDNDQVPEILISTEIGGMLDTPEGLKPFKKIQHEVFEPAGNKVIYDLELTRGFNRSIGNNIDLQKSLTPLEFLNHKYFEPIYKTYQSEKINALLTEMQLASGQDLEKLEALVPVRETNNNQFVVDLGYNYYELFLLVDSAGIELDNSVPIDFPLLYVEDHGEYVYSIEKAQIESDVILFTLDRLYHKDEHSGALNKEYIGPITLTAMPYNNQWVVSYQGNPLMLKTAADQLEQINSNEGQ